MTKIVLSFSDPYFIREPVQLRPGLIADMQLFTGNDVYLHWLTRSAFLTGLRSPLGPYSTFGVNGDMHSEAKILRGSRRLCINSQFANA